MMRAEVEAPLDVLVNCLVHLVMALNQVDECRALRDRLIAAQQDVECYPKTGPHSLAAVLRARMVERGWSEEMMARVGVSEFNIRQVLDRS